MDKLEEAAQCDIAAGGPFNPKGTIYYCSCDAYIGQTGQVISIGKDIVILPKGCPKCKEEYGKS